MPVRMVWRRRQIRWREPSDTGYEAEKAGTSNRDRAKKKSGAVEGGQALMDTASGRLRAEGNYSLSVMRDWKERLRWKKGRRR